MTGTALQILDRSSVAMPDTPRNQAAYPQSASQRPGLGFPIAQVLVVFSPAVGTVLEAGSGPQAPHLVRCWTIGTPSP